MEKTRVKLMLDYPFFGILALSLQLTQRHSVGTLATNGKHLFYNKRYTDSLTPQERLFWYIHEIGHVILFHMFRRDDRNFELWNVACDHAVNLMIKDSVGTSLPEGALYNEAYAGLSAEEIYSKLIEQIKKQQQNGGGQGDDSEDDQDEDDQSENDSGDGNFESEFPEDIQRQIEQAMEHGTVEDAPEDLEQHEVEAVVTSAAAVNQLSGDLGVAKGTALDREIERITSKKVPWQAILQRFITETCQADYSWMKPNLKYRQISKGFILPSLHTEKEINIAVVFDTSGSIDQQKCSRFFAEFLNMLEEIEFKELHALSCSHEVFNPQVFHKGEDIEYTPEGWGGTAAAPVWEYFEDQDIIPSCVVYFTDLEIFDFGANPGYPVIWIVDKGGYYDEYFEQNLPFGEIVFMD